MTTASYLASVQYGRTTVLENFVTDLPDLGPAEKCVVRSDRGLELGEVVSPPDPLPPGLSPDLFPRVLRRATPDDLQRAATLPQQREEALAFARQEAARHRLAIEVVDVDLTFGGEQMQVVFEQKGLTNLAPLNRALTDRYRARVEFTPTPPPRKTGGGGCSGGG